MSNLRRVEGGICGGHVTCGSAANPPPTYGQDRSCRGASNRTCAKGAGCLTRDAIKARTGKAAGQYFRQHRCTEYCQVDKMNLSKLFWHKLHPLANARWIARRSGVIGRGEPTRRQTSGNAFGSTPTHAQ
ncbi:MAG: hypothetical protein JNJ60_15170 [Rhodocyclaceae bacterium]|nr:hypothetical protein [Rhodocyclaceae bacterium]